MDSQWERVFNERMNDFGSRFGDTGLSISIKVRVASGCFHRQCSPRAYEIIDHQLTEAQLDHVDFVEHESGPELLVWLALGTAGIALAKSIVDLLETIIKARTEGIEKGDGPSAPLELIVRGMKDDGRFREERVMAIRCHDPLDRKRLTEALTSAIERQADTSPDVPMEQQADEDDDKAQGDGGQDD